VTYESARSNPWTKIASRCQQPASYVKKVCDTTMKEFLTTTLSVVLALSLVGQSSARYHRFDEQPGYADDDEADEYFIDNIERRANAAAAGGDWCARWGDYCVPDAQVRFATCCKGMRCSCGRFFWNPGKCLCKKSSVFGRR